MSHHWFNPPTPVLCQDCGGDLLDSRHHRRCNPGRILEGYGRPGNGWCRLPAEHDGGCEIVWWNGEVTDLEGNVIEEAPPRVIGGVTYG